MDHQLRTTALKRFVVLLYDRTSSQEYVNEARNHFFTQSGRSIEAMPPTREALRQHIKRAAYQAGFCWGQMMIAHQQSSHRQVNGVGGYIGQPSRRQLRHAGN
ncbi:hypothetical protein Pcinc_018220 [Petrolisthes cinctipes]|uniref:Uncharacterized protein n=1 Tax=Petrolisthes cinctipes TaxID=88211 RepID=A0AAE1KJH2_PETCI|nr:hypothetical protein Pcinc_018220 [Petrolisthes cinctipes]